MRKSQIGTSVMISDSNSGATRLSAPVIPLNGLKLWVTPASIQPAGLNVNITQWADVSGSGNHLFPVGADGQPLTGTGINGLRSAVFDGTDLTLATASPIISGATDKTMFFEYQNTFTSYVGRIGGTNGDDVTTGSWFFINTVLGGQEPYLSGLNADVIGTLTQDLNPHLVSAANDSSSPHQYLYFDGVLVQNGAFSYNTAVNPFYVGNCGPETSFSAPFTGLISEVMVYNRLLSASELTIVHNYLKSKYGL